MSALVFMIEGEMASKLPYIMLDIVSYYEGTTKSKPGIIKKYKENNPEDKITVKGLEIRCDMAKKVMSQLNANNTSFLLQSYDERKILLDAMTDGTMCYKNAIDLYLVAFNTDKVLLEEVKKRAYILNKTIIYIRNRS